ncbi:hypothetical protein AWB65_06293 [Caballeronia humi]|uniref:Uncharacterized protein n=1 Tax=Caballeronia humi TaxID=326474 RepID=A0A158JBC4_9BURK|nr:hypothetical protein AWB65_06293 [Caballeronia humi]
MDVLRDARKSIGIARLMNTFASGHMFCGSKREVPKGEKMNIGVS